MSRWTVNPSPEERRGVGCNRSVKPSLIVAYEGSVGCRILGGGGGGDPENGWQRWGGD